jgi:hypothetical protein
MEMKRAFAATAMVALSFALVGCATTAADNSEVKLKATVKNNKVSGQWEVQTAEDYKNGEFGGKAPKTVEVGSFENIESIYASAHRVFNSPNMLTLELIVDGKTVDKASTKDRHGQVTVEYSGD